MDDYQVTINKLQNLQIDTIKKQEQKQDQNDKDEEIHRILVQLQMSDNVSQDIVSELTLHK